MIWVDTAVYFAHAGDEPLRYALSGVPKNATLQIDATAGVLTGKAGIGVNIPFSVTVTATDRQGSSASAQFLLGSLRVPHSSNHAPEAAPIPSVSARVGAVLVHGVASSFSDRDGDDLVFTARGLSAGTGLSLDRVSGILTGSPSIEDLSNSPLFVSIIATDSKGWNAAADLKIEIFPPGAKGINSSPISASLPSVSAGVGETINIPVWLAFSDPDGDNLVYNVSGLPEESSLSLDTYAGILRGVVSTAEESSSPLSLIVTASDQRGGHVSTRFTLVVVPTDSPLSDSQTGVFRPMHSSDTTMYLPPVATEVPPMHASADALFSADLSRFIFASAWLLGSLRYSIEGLPVQSGFSIIPETGVLFGIPSQADVMSLQPILLTIRASDTLGITTSAPLQLLVSESGGIRSAPLDSITVTAGQDISVDLSCNFQNSGLKKQVVYSQTGLPTYSGLYITSHGYLSGRATVADVIAKQPLTLTIIASDPAGNQASENLLIAVNPGLAFKFAENTRPMGEAIPGFTARVGEFFFANTSVYFSDPDALDPLIFAISGLSEGSGLSLSSDGLLAGVPNSEDVKISKNGMMTLIITAVDGEGAAAASVLALALEPARPGASTISQLVRSQKSCNDLGWADVHGRGVCGSGALSVGQTCPSLTSHEQAQATCHNIGARLCTIEEVKLGIGETSECAGASGLVWTSDSCWTTPKNRQPSRLGFLAGYGSSKVGARRSAMCIGPKRRQKMRCCADAPSVAKQATNHAPVVRGRLPEAAAVVDAPMLLDVSSFFSDPDDDQLEYTLYGLPAQSGLSLSTEYGYLAGTPAASDLAASPISLVASASDGKGGSVQVPLLLRVQAFDDKDEQVGAHAGPQDLGSKQVFYSSQATAVYIVSMNVNPTHTYPTDTIQVRIGQKIFWDLFDEAPRSTLKVAGLPRDTGIRLSSNGLLTGVPTLGDLAASPIQVVLTTSASHGLSRQFLAHLDVIPGPEGILFPTSVTIPQVSIREGAILDPIMFKDYFLSDGLDSSALEYDVQGLPDGTGIKVAPEGFLYGQANSLDVLFSMRSNGILGLTIKATNRKGISVTEPWNIAVIPQKNLLEYADQSSGLLSGVIHADTVSSSSCSQLGWPLDLDYSSTVCGFSKVTKGRCSGEVDYWQAEEICLSQGGRLCSSEELEQGVASSAACGLDSARIWTSSQCQQQLTVEDGNTVPGVITLGGGGDKGGLQPTCSSTSSKFAVRCCADSFTDILRLDVDARSYGPGQDEDYPRFINKNTFLKGVYQNDLFVASDWRFPEGFVPQINNAPLSVPLPIFNIPSNDTVNIFCNAVIP